MEREQFEGMSLDELWQLHTVVNSILTAKMVARKEEVDRLLGQVHEERPHRHSEH